MEIIDFDEVLTTDSDYCFIWREGSSITMVRKYAKNEINVLGSQYFIKL
jgi:hypothetical protein